MKVFFGLQNIPFGLSTLNYRKCIDICNPDIELMQEALPFCFSLPEEGQALAARMLPFLGIEQYEQILDISHINVCKAYHKVQELMSLGFSHFFSLFHYRNFIFLLFLLFDSFSNILRNIEWRNSLDFSPFRNP